jgi:flagellar basal-body rod modification protein FlgD
VNQLAQMTLVEQSVAQSSSLSTISTQLSALTNASDTNMIGKQVTVNESTLAFGGTFAATTNVTLQGAAASVTAQILDAGGNPIRTLQMGPSAAGNLAITWDGKNNSGTMQPAGNYQVQVAATSASGASVNVSSTVTDTVNNVSYVNGVAQLGLQSGATASLTNITNIAAAPVAPTTTSTTSSTGQ